MNDSTGYKGAQDPANGACEFNATSFLVEQLLNKSNTATLVQVKSVNLTTLTVDVVPLVSQVAGDNTLMPHTTIFGIPFVRVQGGANAVIINPKVNDIGLAVFADHDISVVKETKKESPPGSKRRFAMSDGVYIGGLLNGTPTQFIEFTDTGITVTSPMIVTINASVVAINSSSLTHNGKNIGSTHTHTGVQTGGGITGAPT